MVSYYVVFQATDVKIKVYFWGLAMLAKLIVNESNCIFQKLMFSAFFSLSISCLGSVQFFNSSWTTACSAANPYKDQGSPMFLSSQLRVTLTLKHTP